MSIPTANRKRLHDSNIRQNDKLQITAYLKKSDILKLDNLLELTDAKSRNEVLEQAIDFYFGFHTSQVSQDYLCSTLGVKTEGLIGNLGNRLSRIQFKTAVELDMLARMMTCLVQIDNSDYEKLRKKSVYSVKSTNGSIDIMQAIEEQE